MLGACAWAAEPLRIVCVGDSITSGWGGNQQDSYPSVLGRLLGPNYEVVNGAGSGCVILKKGRNPYWDNPAFKRVTESSPRAIVFMLGTNDANPASWTDHHGEFEADATALIAHFKNLPSKPLVLIALPPPVGAGNSFGTKEENAVEVRRILREVAVKNRLPVIDVNAAMTVRPELFKDGVHPNREGARFLAQTVAKGLADAGLRP